MLLMVPLQSRSSLEWRRAWGNPTAPLPLYRKYSRYRTRVRWAVGSVRSLLRCSGSIPCSIRSGMIRASRNSAKRNQIELAQLFRRAEAAERLQGRGGLCDCRLALDSGSVDLVPDLRSASVGDEGFHRSNRAWISNCAYHRLGIRTNTRRN